MTFQQREYRKWYQYKKDCSDFVPNKDYPHECVRSKDCKWVSQGYVSRDTTGCTGYKRETLKKTFNWADEDL